MSLRDRLPFGGSGGRNGDDRRRRRLLLVLVLFLVVIGAGIGTVAFTGPPDPGPDDATPTATADPATTPVPTPQRTANVSLEFSGDATLVRAGSVAPGDSGTARLSLRNNGSLAGRLGVTDIAVTDAENGQGDAEAAVDNSTDAGELSGALLVRLTVRYPDGETVRVVGDDGYVPLDDVTLANETLGGTLDPGQTATIVLDWRVDTAAGNEIQSDRTRFDAVFELRSLDATATGTP